ncbi:MAG TPA: 4-alpha-glucanotransferase [Chromatiaceae bacterium]|nr:4-alpha-glucanotransferase [Chromatiaceae bacterium]
MPYDLQQRRAGVLLHPTSFPSGTLRDAAPWLDFLDATGLSVWQVLPLGIPQDNHSPYQCLSAFAANPRLLDDASPLEPDHEEFHAYCTAQDHWLEDYALFRQIKHLYNGLSWVQWPEALKWRDTEALHAIGKQHAGALLELKWEQYQLHCRWQQIRTDAHRRKLALFGDMPIFVAHDSADVWACPQRFLLDDDGQPTWVAGVPPDYFSETGQRWGNPHYDWQRHKQENFEWWVARMQNHFEWFDLVRIDHFRGLQAVWMIDAEAETAEKGHWQEVPGDELLATLRERLGSLPLVAEDLGIITPEVRALKEKYHLPGMAILQFSFDHFEDNPNKPQNIGPNTVVYTGTHDNDTTLGWFRSLDAPMQAHVLSVLGIREEKEVAPAMIRTAMQSRANLAMVPLQDFLGLGSEARMNVPGVAEGNWRWKFHWEQLSAPERIEWIRQQVSDSQREVKA